MLSSIAIFHLAVLCIFNPIHCFEQLPRDIALVEILSDVVNQIFSNLQFKTNMTRKIKEYSKMHKNFVTLTQQEKYNWMELLKLTSLDIEIDNSTADYTTIINEVLNEENKIEVVNDTLNEENVNKHIEDFLATLAKLKELYLHNNSYITVNYEMLHRFHKAHRSPRNNTVDRLYLTQNDSDFWVPDSRRIFQGKRTNIKHFPFVASVHMFDQFSCAGSIIHDDLVITAASCLQLVHNNRFYRENPSFLSVRIGSSSYSGGDRVPVLEVYFYPSYEPKTLRNNLAIMRLQRVIRFRKKNKNVRKIRVDTNAWALPSDTDGITIIGWGARTASNKVYNPWKNKLAMDILYFYGLADCRDIYSKEHVTKKNFCGGFISRGGGACNRDVGAPGVVDGILTGVVSFGSPNCGALDSPTVFTKLGYYIDWIEDIMEQEPPRHSVRMTSRRPHLFHTIMSTRPSPEMNFLIEPMDLHKVPDFREMNVRMPQDDKNEFLELSAIKPASSKQTFPSMQIMNEKLKGFEDATRVRDETKVSVETGTTYEPAGFQAIGTVMDSFDLYEYPLGEGDTKLSIKVTTEEAIFVTKAQNKELKPAKPKLQINLPDLGVRMPQDDKNEFLNAELSSKKPASSRQTYPGMQIVNKKLKGFMDDTRIRDEIKVSVETEPTYEPAGFQAIGTVMDNFDFYENPLSDGDKKFSMKFTTGEAIVGTKAQNKELKPAKPKLQIDLAQESKSFEDSTEISIDIGQFFLDTHNSELNKIPSSGIDKGFGANQTETEKIFYLNDKDEDNGTVPVQQSLPILLFSNEKGLPVETSKMEVARNKIDGSGHVVKHKKKQQIIVEFEKAIDKFIDNLNIDKIFRSEEVLERKVFNATGSPADIQSQVVKHTAVNNVKSPQNDVLPLQNQETEQAPVNNDVFPLQNQETEQAPVNNDVFPLQNQETEQAPVNNDVFPLQNQETEQAPVNIDVFPLQNHETKPAPKEDVISFLYLSDSELKPEKPEHGKLNIGSANFKDNTYRNIIKSFP